VLSCRAKIKLKEARVIQRAWKSYRLRVNAAVIIQKFCRGYLARKAYVARKVEEESRKTHEPDQTKADSSNLDPTKALEDARREIADKNATAVGLAGPADGDLKVVDDAQSSRPVEVIKSTVRVDEPVDDVFSDVTPSLENKQREPLETQKIIKSSTHVDSASEASPAVVDKLDPVRSGGDRLSADNHSQSLERSPEPPQRNRKKRVEVPDDRAPDPRSRPLRANNEQDNKLRGNTAVKLSSGLSLSLGDLTQTPVEENSRHSRKPLGAVRSAATGAATMQPVKTIKTEDSELYNLKAGDLFMKAAFSKPESGVVKPVVFKPHSTKRKRIFDEIGKNQVPGPVVAETSSDADKSNAPENHQGPAPGQESRAAPEQNGTDKPDATLPFVKDAAYDLLKKQAEPVREEKFRYLSPNETFTPPEKDKGGDQDRKALKVASEKKPSVLKIPKPISPPATSAASTLDVGGQFMEKDSDLLKPDDVVLSGVSDSGEYEAHEFDSYIIAECFCSKLF